MHCSGSLPPMGPVGAQGSERPRAKSPYPRKIYGGSPRSREGPSTSCRPRGPKWLRGFPKAPWKSFGDPRGPRDCFGFPGVSTIFRASPPTPPQSPRGGGGAGGRAPGFESPVCSPEPVGARRTDPSPGARSRGFPQVSFKFYQIHLTTYLNSSMFPSCS